MHFAKSVAYLALAAISSTVTASPTILSTREAKSDKGFPPSKSWYGGGSTCLAPAIGSEIVTQFVSLLTNFNNATATNLLAPSFADTSDSINYIAGIPLGSVTFPSAQAFIAGQGAQPPIGLTVINIDAVTCDGVIVFRWVAQVGSQKDEVKGINVLNARLVGKDAYAVGPNGWQLIAVFSEFNSAAWITDLGGSCPPPSFG